MLKLGALFLTAVATSASASGRVRARNAVSRDIFAASSVPIVQQSWADVLDVVDNNAEAAGMLFYGNFFGNEFPAVRPIYPSDDDMPALAVKLITTLNFAVDNLENLDVLAPALTDLGALHADFCVYPSYFPPIVSGVFWVLKTALGDSYTQDIENAWGDVLTTVASVMSPAMEANGYDNGVYAQQKCVELKSFDGCDNKCGEGTSCVEQQCVADPCPGDSNSPCCDPGSSCEDTAIADFCVCTFDSFCCNTEWDMQCVEEAQQACDMECV